MKLTSLKSKIISPFLIIVIASFLITLILFNIFVSIYFRKQAQSEINRSITATEKLINRNLNIDEQVLAFPLLVKKLKALYKASSAFHDVHSIIISSKYKLLYPNAKNDLDEEYIQEYIMPQIMSHAVALRGNRSFVIRADNTKYLVGAYQLTPRKANGNGGGYILYYIDLSQSGQFLKEMDIVLLAILFLAACISIFSAIMISNRIAKPIRQLCQYAKTIGERDFVSAAFEDTSVEVQELANSMKHMAYQLSEYDKSQKTFFQNISHELRTPLMSIQGYAEGLKLGVFEDQDQALNTIIDESIRLTSQVEELLYLSRLDSIYEVFTPEYIDLRDIVSLSINRAQGLAVKYNRNVISKIPNHTIMIHAEGEKISEALLNIIANCLRYAKSQVHISISSDDNYAVVKIADDGQGLSQEDIDHIFNRFYKGKDGNFGLGLYLAKTIIIRNHGEIVARNGESGAEFIVKLLLE